MKIRKRFKELVLSVMWVPVIGLMPSGLAAHTFIGSLEPSCWPSSILPLQTDKCNMSGAMQPSLRSAHHCLSNGFPRGKEPMETESSLGKDHGTS